MTPSHNPGPFSSLRQDLPAGLVVFLVAVPLCLGIALASGAPLFAGIISGIVGGIVVTLFSGSSLGVSGPAAGLAVIVLTAIGELGFEAFLLAVVIAGAIQLLLGFARAGIIGYYFPSSVIKGMLAGIGVIIFLKQIPHAFGYDKDYEGDLAFQQPDGHNTFSEFYYMLDAVTPGAIVITVISLIILILWEQPFMKRRRVFQLIQGPLVVVAGGIMLNLLFRGIPALSIGGDHVVSLPVPDSFQGFIAQFTTPDFAAWNNAKVWTIALTLAVVASLETLLCVEATDKLDPYKRVTPTNRELMAQGLGNMVAGLIGGLPVTQVIVRSSANIQSGGRTKTSAFIHGLMLLVCAALIPTVLNLIPLASLAAILLLVGYKLAKPALFRSMWRLGKDQFVPFAATILGLVFTDLLIGVALGLVIAGFYILYTNYRTAYALHVSTSEHGKAIRIELAEDISFLNKAAIQRILSEVKPDSKVLIDASKSVHVDHDVREILDEFAVHAGHEDIKFEVIGMPPELGRGGRVIVKRSDAIKTEAAMR